MRETLTTRGFVVNRFQFSNTTLIVSWITPDAGLLKTLAKGALRANSPFAATLDLFYLCELSCTVSAKSDLTTLKDLKLEKPFLPLRRDWRVILCAQYFAELFGMLTEPHAPVPDYFEVYEKALVYLETHLPNLNLIQRYEKKLLTLGGFPTDSPSALAKGLAVHHHGVPSLREKLLESMKNGEKMPALRPSGGHLQNPSAVKVEADFESLAEDG